MTRFLLIEAMLIALARLTFALFLRPVKISIDEPESVKIRQKIARKT